MSTSSLKSYSNYIELCAVCKPITYDYKKVRINVNIIEFLSRYYTLDDILDAIIIFGRYYHLKRKDALMEIMKENPTYYNVILDLLTFYYQ